MKLTFLSSRLEVVILGRQRRDHLGRIYILLLFYMDFDRVVGRTLTASSDGL